MEKSSNTCSPFWSLDSPAISLSFLHRQCALRGKGNFLEKSSNTCSPFWSLDSPAISLSFLHRQCALRGKGNFLEKMGYFLVVTDYQTSS